MTSPSDEEIELELLRRARQRKARLRSNRTGEDIDMLNERKQNESDSGANSTKYKDHIDGA